MVCGLPDSTLQPCHVRKPGQCNALLLAAGAAGGRGKPDSRAAILEFSCAVSDILATEEPGWVGGQPTSHVATVVPD